MSENENGNHRDVITNGVSEGEMPQGQPANGEMALDTNFKLKVSLWLTRLKIIFLVIVYLLSWRVFENCYHKILLAHSAANFVYLQQRMSKPQLKLKYLKKLLLDDCSINILYSLILFCYSPLPWVWLPIFLFAILHSANHPWFDKMDEFGLIGKSTKFVESHSTSILRIIAVTEIFILALIPFHLQYWSFSQIVLTLITTCIYLKFLAMRFNSRQNPFTRIVLSQLRDEIESLAVKPFCPATVRNLLFKVATFLTSRFGLKNELQDFICTKKPLFGKNGFLSGLA